ncbi:MAG: hypothetical protein LBU55_01270 [Elusimicrobiota bacterium]|jgi:hypothetical protein|nr:hypothetical protein [Elusimicrobiota bacterium]
MRKDQEMKQEEMEREYSYIHDGILEFFKATNGFTEGTYDVCSSIARRIIKRDYKSGEVESALREMEEIVYSTPVSLASFLGVLSRNREKVKKIIEKIKEKQKGTDINCPFCLNSGSVRMSMSTNDPMVCNYNGYKALIRCKCEHGDKIDFKDLTKKGVIFSFNSKWSGEKKQLVFSNSSLEVSIHVDEYCSFILSLTCEETKEYLEMVNCCQYEKMKDFFVKKGFVKWQEK